MSTRTLFAALFTFLATLSATAQYRFVLSDAQTAPEELTSGTYVIYAITANATGYIYNANMSGENFRVSTNSHPNYFEDDETVQPKYAWDLQMSDDGTFTLRNLATGNYLPADKTRNQNCKGNTSEAARLCTDDIGTLWQTNYNYEGDVLYLHTNYRSDDRCLSYWNDCTNPGTGTALKVMFFPCETEEVFDVCVGNGTFYRKTWAGESAESNNSVYKYISSGSSPQLTITSGNNENDIVVPAFDWYSGTSHAQQYTLSISSGYRITGYEIVFNNGDSSIPMTITPAEGGIAETAQGSDEAYISVCDLHTQSTSFTISASDHKPAHISSFLVYYEKPHKATFELLVNDSIVMTAETEAFEGDELTIPETFTVLPYTNLRWDSPCIMRGEDMTVPVYYEWNGPFAIGESYFMCIGDTIDKDGNLSTWGPLSYIDADAYDGTCIDLASCGTYGCENALGRPQNLQTSSGLWKFEGSAWTGFTITSHDGLLLASLPVDPNSASGMNSPLVLTAPEDAAAEGFITLWDVAPATSQGVVGGFFLRQHGTSYSVNERQDGSHMFLAYWTGGESTGSVIRVSNTLPEREALRVSGIGYSTSYYPFATKIPEGANLNAYTLTLSDNGANLELHEVADGMIPANEPVLLMGEDNPPLLPVVSDGLVRSQENILTGTLDSINVEDANRSDYLVLSWMLRTGFYTSSTLKTILPHTAYIDNTLLSSARGLPLGAVTAISTVISNSANTNEVFDLQGRRVTNPKGGIYIVGGRKVLIP